MAETYTIGQLAAEAGVNVETIRYYQRRNLVREPPRPSGSVRRYTESDAERLRFIKRAQVMGFALSEIDSRLKLRAGRSCLSMRDLAVSKLEFVDARIRELRHLRKELAALVAKCDANMDAEGCPIIEQLIASGNA